MKIEHINKETVITLPESIQFSHLQKFIDYLTVKSLLNKSAASNLEADQLAEEVQSKWWKENKHLFIK